jgi:hypothetical protein
MPPTDAYATCNGQRLTHLYVNVGNVGPWLAELDFEAAPEVSGSVEIRAGGLVLRGTIEPSQSGTHLDQRRCRVVAGAGGWSHVVPRKSYHNDAGVKARLVADDAAREVGESIGDFYPAYERIGKDYVRHVGPASRVLEHVIGAGVPWWVAYDGRTHVGPRTPQPLSLSPEAGVDVLAYDPRNSSVTFAINDPGLVQVGSVLAQAPLAQPVTIREFDLYVSASSTRVIAWCGGDSTDRGHLAGLMRAIARRATDDRLWGKYRYRVVTMRDDGRVELQAVRRDAGYPDLKPISVWPGVAGAAAVLTPGTEVLCEFIEGDPTQPIVTHFAGVSGPGFVPVSLTLCGSEQRGARQGDLVQSGGVGCTVILTPVTPAPGSPVLPAVPYLISFSSDPTAVGPLAAPLYGSISTGSPKVKL